MCSLEHNTHDKNTKWFSLLYARLFLKEKRGSKSFFRKKKGEKKSKPFLSEKIRGTKTFFPLKKGDE